MHDIIVPSSHQVGRSLAVLVPPSLSRQYHHPPSCCQTAECTAEHDHWETVFAILTHVTFGNLGKAYMHKCTINVRIKQAIMADTHNAIHECQPTAHASSLYGSLNKTLRMLNVTKHEDKYSTSC